MKALRAIALALEAVICLRFRCEMRHGRVNRAKIGTRPLMADSGRPMSFEMWR